MYTPPTHCLSSDIFFIYAEIQGERERFDVYRNIYQITHNSTAGTSTQATGASGKDMLCATFSHDGSLISTGTADGTVKVRSLNILTAVSEVLSMCPPPSICQVCSSESIIGAVDPTRFSKPFVRSITDHSNVSVPLYFTQDASQSTHASPWSRLGRPIVGGDLGVVPSQQYSGCISFTG